MDSPISASRLSRHERIVRSYRYPGCGLLALEREPRPVQALWVGIREVALAALAHDLACKVRPFSQHAYFGSRIILPRTLSLSHSSISSITLSFSPGRHMPHAST